MVSLYHRKLLDDFGMADISTEIDTAMRYINSETVPMDISFRDALLNRLQFRKMLLSAVRLDGISDHSRARSWEQCLEILPMLSQTSRLGIPSDDSFGIKIQRKLASSVPPRPIVKISFDDALARLNDICENGRDAYRIFGIQTGTCLMVCNSDILRLPESVLTYCQTFVMTYQSRKPEPSIYIRCLLQSLIFSEMKVLGTISMKQFLFDDFEELVLPADILIDPENGHSEAPQDPRFQISQRMDAFATKAASVSMI